jgi:hypothetical protein
VRNKKEQGETRSFLFWFLVENLFYCLVTISQMTRGGDVVWEYSNLNVGDLVVGIVVSRIAAHGTVLTTAAGPV